MRRHVARLLAADGCHVVELDADRDPRELQRKLEAELGRAADMPPESPRLTIWRWMTANEGRLVLVLVIARAPHRRALAIWLGQIGHATHHTRLAVVCLASPEARRALGELRVLRAAEPLRLDALG
ncbi:hypothetical protein [Sorangium sp. So ce1000]|uniref:hypothetical protein n=1 Tax=Sorangium sp. So ce1000 TaxID=3133325 RepID=UPI003F62BFAF